jgi:hypothetical protein
MGMPVLLVTVDVMRAVWVSVQAPADLADDIEVDRLCNARQEILILGRDLYRLACVTLWRTDRRLGRHAGKVEVLGELVE